MTRMIWSLGLGVAMVAMMGTTPSVGADGERVFEIRTYHCVPGRLPALNKRFQDHTIALFTKHGIESIAYWTPTDEKDAPADTLIYIVAYPSRAAAAKSWEAFRNDPEWKKAQSESEKDGKIVAKVDSVYLTPTQYSMMK